MTFLRWEGVERGVVWATGLSVAAELAEDIWLLPPLASVTTCKGALGGEANIDESENDIRYRIFRQNPIVYGGNERSALVLHRQQGSKSSSACEYNR